MVSKLIRTGAGLTAAALVLAGCATEGGEAPEGDGTFSIYASLSLTGALGSSSQAQLDGLEITVDAINEDGGINGEQIELTVVDDQLDTTTAVTLLQEHLDSEGNPDAVYHGVSSSITLAMLPLLTRNEIVSIGTPYSDDINQPSEYPYAFGTNPEVRLDPEAAVELFEDEGFQTVAYLGDNAALGQSIAEAFQEVFSETDMDLTVETYAEDALDMTAQLQRLQATDPDVLVVQGYGTAAGYALESRTKLGWDIPTYGDGGLGNGNNLAQISDESDWSNLYLRVFAVNTEQRELTPSFDYLSNAVEESDSSFDQLFQLYSFPWDAVHVIRQAVEQTDSKVGADVAVALEDLDPIEGESPYITFSEFTYSPENHFINQTPDIYTVVRPGPVVEGTIQSID